MKKSLKRFRSLLLIMLCVILVVPCMNVSAATQKQKALAAYKKFLSTAKVNVIKKGAYYDGSVDAYTGTSASSVKFGVAYINKDNIPDLVVYTSVKGTKGLYGIFTYRNGKIRRLWDRNGDEKLLGYYKKTGFVASRSYPHGEWLSYAYYYQKLAYKYSNNTAEPFVKGLNPYESKDWKYHAYNKKVTKKVFTAKFKKATSGKTLTKIKYYKNTAANRNRILK